MSPRGQEGVSPVIATILLVAITVVLTSVLYIVVTNIASDVGRPPPAVAFIRESRTATSTVYTVHLSGQMSYQFLTAKLFVNYTEDTSSTIGPLAVGTHGNVTFDDRDGSGTLTSGDAFLIATLPSQTYEFMLFWSDDLAQYDRWDT